MPHSLDREYAERAIVQYESAIAQAGGEPVRVPLEQPESAIKKIAASCDAVLLPGSKADVDPAKYGAERSPRSAACDAMRDSTDTLLLQDAYAFRKPILGICYGLQSLNVFRAGSLIQHIPDFLPEDLRTRVNHDAGRKVAVAHSVELERGSKLAEILCGESRLSDGTQSKLPVNSSHHQSADTTGEGLRVSASCPDDGIIEALEGTDPEHFVVAVQWHPERSVDDDAPSRAIFRALIDAAAAHRK